MRGLLLLFVPAAFGQTWAVEPSTVQQGETIRLRTTASNAVSARMQDLTVRLFPDDNGTRYGLMPVPALMAPDKYEVVFFNAEGAALHTAAVTVRDGNFPEQNIRIGKAIQELRPSPGEFETMTALRKTVSNDRHWAEPFAAPLPGCMTSPYGVKRLHNGKPTGSYHSGVDQRALAERPIRAIAAGVVRVSRMFNIHGGTVGLDHGHGVTSAYLHMSRFAVTEGARVEKGQVIGYVGSTGRSTAPHLHWSIAVNGVQVNPREWVRLTPCGARQVQKRTRPPRARR